MAKPKNKNKPASQEDIDQIMSEVSEAEPSEKLKAHVAEAPKKVHHDVSKHSKFDKFKKGSN